MDTTLLQKAIGGTLPFGEIQTYKQRYSKCADERQGLTLQFREARQKAEEVLRAVDDPNGVVLNGFRRRQRS